MISVIIPAYNEALHIQATIRNLRQEDKNNQIKEVIVADGGSSDDTIQLARSEGVKVVVSTKKSRATQMNCGASHATEEILYFIHADTFPPKNFTKYIVKAQNEGAISGCFRLSFDHKHWFLQTCCWFTRFNINAVRFGDQSLFVTRAAFHKCGRFREDLLMMEDQEIIHRIKKEGKFKVMHAAVITSARKYLDNGVYRLQAIFFRVWLLYYVGYSQKYLLKLHKKLVKNSNL